MNKRLELFLEFLIFGVAMGVVEDMIAIKVVTGESITIHSILIILIVAVPFAAIGELIVDRIEFPRKKRK